MYLHKYKTEVGPAFLVSGSQKPKMNVRLSDWEGKATGSKVDTVLKNLNSIPVFKEEEPKEESKEEVQEKKAVVTLASRIRELASFLTPKE